MTLVISDGEQTARESEPPSPDSRSPDGRVLCVGLGPRAQHMEKYADTLYFCEDGAELESSVADAMKFAMHEVAPGLELVATGGNGTVPTFVGTVFEPHYGVAEPNIMSVRGPQCTLHEPSAEEMSTCVGMGLTMHSQDLPNRLVKESSVSDLYYRHTASVVKGAPLYFLIRLGEEQSVSVQLRSGESVSTAVRRPATVEELQRAEVCGWNALWSNVLLYIDSFTERHLQHIRTLAPNDAEREKVDVFLRMKETGTPGLSRHYAGMFRSLSTGQRY